jgi:putative transposase
MARIICPRIPHHGTQRGNRREDVFFTDADRTSYLKWLSNDAEKHQVEVLAYCLMTNHIHLVAVPDSEEAMHRMLKPLHMRYAQRINRRKGWKGHLWQGRFFSSALDEDYLWAAIRYVERNPVRARIVRKAENYPWPSAAGHCGIKADRVLCCKPDWQRQLESIGDWSTWLATGDEPDQLEILRRNADKGLACGSDKFIHRLEKLVGWALAFRPPGRPKKSSEKGSVPFSHWERVGGGAGQMAEVR